MKLLNTYESKEDAEIAFQTIAGEKRLASERDGTMIVYNLFGLSTWSNFYKLDMFNLKELEIILKVRNTSASFDENRHAEIINMLQYVAKSFDLKIPTHWL